MSNSNPSRLGQVNSAGDVLALMLKVFSGEVLTAFQRESLMKNFVIRRTINNGKSAQFPVLGIAQARQHQPGTEILGQKLNANERVINIEGLNISDVFISNIDEWMNHYDVRGPHATELGQALAKLRDQNAIHTVANAARVTAANVKGVYPNDTLASTVINALFATDGSVLVNGMYDGIVQFDIRDIPMSDRFALVRPIQHALAVKSGLLTNVEINGLATDLGGLVTGQVKAVNNVPIYKTNNYTAVDDRTSEIQPGIRQKDYSTSQFLLGHKSSTGELMLKDMVMESEYDMRRQGTLMLGKFISGNDVLRPEAAFEGQSAAPAA